jgi:hypothetical protein
MGAYRSVYTNGTDDPVAYSISTETSTIDASKFEAESIFVGVWKGKYNNTEDITLYITADKWITVGKAKGTYSPSGSNTVTATITHNWGNSGPMPDWETAGSGTPASFILTVSSDGNTLTGGPAGQSMTLTRSTVGDGIAKTLVITGIPASVYAYGKDGGGIGVFPEGTSQENALQQNGVVAAASLKDDDIEAEDEGGGSYTLTIPLHIIGAGDIPWTGTGLHDVYVALFSNNVGHYYKASATFSAATTTIEFSSATELTLQQP